MRLGGAVYGARVRIYGGWDGLLWWSVWAGGWGSGGWLMGCAQSQEVGARVPCHLRFILLGNFNDTLLVVLILDIVYDCHLLPLLQS